MRSVLLTAVGLMVGSTICLGLLDAVAKLLGSRFPVTELVWFRMLVHLLLAAAVFYPSRRGKLFRTTAWRLQLGRSILLMTTGLLFFLALRFLPLAETAAVTFSSPLLTVILAAPVLGEQVTRARLAVAVLGFAGVVAVIQPLSATISAAALLPLAAAVTASVYALLTRRMPLNEDAATTWFYTAIAGTILLPTALPLGWVWPDPSELVPLVMLGILGSIGHLGVIHAYRNAPASMIAPLGYLELLWATLLGVLVFDEFPNAVALAGMVAIAIGGILVAAQTRREQFAVDAH
jgi:drug/metabolite transporter (DMT)-like permease